VGIADRDRQYGFRFRNDLYVIEYGLGGLDAIVAQPQLLFECTPKLIEVNFADHEIVIRQAYAQNIRAKSACRKCRDEDIRVEAYSHEISLKMSSSVKRPRASANGSIWRRASSNCNTAICRRNASRAISLRERPDRFAKSRNLRSVGGSSRMVSVEVFMSYIVTHSGQPSEP
jgi:ribosomal protein L40E